MDASKKFDVFTIPSHLHWLAEEDRVLIADKNGEHSWLLEGQAAVLWQRLPEETSFRGLVEYRMLLLEENRVKAETSVRQIWNQWLGLGLLIPLRSQE